MKYKVKQIFYPHWSAKLEPGHENYWIKINTIANWIGFALEGSVTSYYQTRYQYSTISVKQTKEKFGACRVYCDLAYAPYIDIKFEDHKKDLQQGDKKYFRWLNGLIKDSQIRSDLLKAYQQGQYPQTPGTLDDFAKTCLDNDKKWYQKIYKDAIILWPEYEIAITSAMDYPNLLKSDKGNKE